jgi:hypothetical protein
MRKRLTLALAAAVAVTVIVVGVAAAAQSPVLQGPNGNTQSIAVNITPQKVSKTTPTPATLFVKTATTRPSDPNGVPVPAVKAVVDFPKDLSIFSKGYPTCDDAVLQNASTEVALQECKKAKIGVGAGTALLPVGTKVFPVTTTITAFNGVPQGGKPVILLHTYSEKPVTTTIVLIGVVKRYNKQGFGPRLDVTIPLLAGGAGALTGFEVKVFKKFSYKGKLRSYISSTCSSKKWKFRGEFVFRDGEALTPTATGKCSQSKK